MPGLPRPAISAHIIATNPTLVCPAGRNVYLTKSIKNKKDEKEEEEWRRGRDWTSYRPESYFQGVVGLVMHNIFLPPPRSHERTDDRNSPFRSGTITFKIIDN